MAWESGLVDVGNTSGARSDVHPRIISLAGLDGVLRMTRTTCERLIILASTTCGRLAYTLQRRNNAKEAIEKQRR